MKINIDTHKKREVLDITSEIEKNLEGSGLVNIFIKHTTAAITTADLDPGGTDEDYLNAFDEIIPKLKFNHPHDPSHMPDHILATLIGPSLSIPFENGKLNLGTWQRVVLFEFDGPRKRDIVISIMSK